MDKPGLTQRLSFLARDALRRPERPVLIALLLLTSLAWGFYKLAAEVQQGDTQAFDQHVVDVLRNPQNPRLPRGPAWLVEAGRDVTALGGVAVLGLMTLAAAGYLLLDGKRAAALLMLAAIAGGLAAAGLLKHFFERPRPAVGSELARVFTSSFPSGHSMLSAIVYLTLGTMIARVEQRRRIKAYFIVVAVLLSGLVGVSRVYLGVHYPSDVLAGWVAGLAWALVWWFIARAVDRRLRSSGPPDAHLAT